MSIDHKANELYHAYNLELYVAESFSPEGRCSTLEEYMGYCRRANDIAREYKQLTGRDIYDHDRKDE